MLLQLEDIKQELIDSAANYKLAIPCPNKNLILVISSPLNIFTGNLQYHHTHSSTAPNLNPYLKTEATIKTHRFQKAKNNISDSVPPTTRGVSCYMISSSGVCITEKIKIHLVIFYPIDVSFLTNTKKQDKYPFISLP